MYDGEGEPFDSIIGGCFRVYGDRWSLLSSHTDGSQSGWSLVLPVDAWVNCEG